MSLANTEQPDRLAGSQNESHKGTKVRHRADSCK